MKIKCVIRMLLVLVAGAIRLTAQQSDADRELFGDTRIKAESGDAVAQAHLAEDYFLGLYGIAKDYPESIKWSRKAADQGFAAAEFNLGTCYYYGQGVPKDYTEAAKWFRKAADQGSDAAEFNLGDCYLEGQGLTQDNVEAAKWFRKAANQGNAAAQFSLGHAYDQGLGVVQDYAEAVKWYRKAADQGAADAQSNLGNRYIDGKGVAQDYVEAVKWFRKAADQGYFGGEFNLGIRYDNGQGVTQDYAEAVKWYRKAADQGCTVAQYNLGIHYEKGQGVVQDYLEAVKWYRKATDQGYAGAQSALGNCYNDGQGVTQDYAEAVKWYRKAADQGDAEAEYNLGNRYKNGLGVQKDEAEAVRWYQKAAEQGVPVAQYNLSAMYANGHGVPRNYIEAYKWQSIAASHGEESAMKYLPILETQMTPDQVSEAQRLAADFAAGKAVADSSSSNSQLRDNPIESGSGFVITDDGYLISNYHVIKDAVKVRLLTAAGLIDATVVKVDAANDLALLKALRRFAPLPIASSRTVRLGATVATVGFPDIGLQGFSPKLAKGEIASLSGVTDAPRYFQISVPLQPGNSGGALVDEHGNVVGIVAAKLDAKSAFNATGALPENVNYAVKSSFLLGFLESVPDVAAKLKDPNTKDESFEDVVKSAQDAAVLVLVY